MRFAVATNKSCRRVALLFAVKGCARQSAMARQIAGFHSCACRKLNPAILVMQPAQDWATKNAPGAIDGARDRRIFLQG